MDIASLRRSPTDAKLGGVCGGLAQTWNVDPTLVRIAAVLLALSSGVGLVLYTMAWLLLPVEGQERSVLDKLLPNSASISFKFWAIMTVALSIIFASTLGTGLPFGWWPGVVLVGLVLLGVRHRQKAESTSSSAPQLAPPQHTAFTVQAAAWQARVEEVAALRSATPTPGTTAPAAIPTGQPTWDVAPVLREAAPEPFPAPSFSNPPTLPPYPTQATDVADPPTPAVDSASSVTGQELATTPRDNLSSATTETTQPAASVVDRRSKRKSRSAKWLFLSTAALLAVVETTMAILSMNGLHIPALAFHATAAIIMGCGLVLSAWLGRSRGFLTLGIISGIVATLVALGVPLAQSTTTVYDAQHPLATSLSLPMGDHTVDLSGVHKADHPLVITADMGKIVIIVGKDQQLHVSWSVDVGSVTIDGMNKSGFDVKGTSEVGPGNAEPITVSVKLDAGEIKVVRK